MRVAPIGAGTRLTDYTCLGYTRPASANHGCAMQVRHNMRARPFSCGSASAVRDQPHSCLRACTEESCEQGAGAMGYPTLGQPGGAAPYP